VCYRWLATQSVSMNCQGITDDFLTSFDGPRKETGGQYTINY
jgi:hypothetical protein